jgi:hypothetical protein
MNTGLWEQAGLWEQVREGLWLDEELQFFGATDFREEQLWLRLHRRNPIHGFAGTWEWVPLNHLEWALPEELFAELLQEQAELQA